MILPHKASDLRIYKPRTELHLPQKQPTFNWTQSMELVGSIQQLFLIPLRFQRSQTSTEKDSASCRVFMWLRQGLTKWHLCIIPTFFLDASNIFQTPQIFCRERLHRLVAMMKRGQWPITNASFQQFFSMHLGYFKDLNFLQERLHGLVAMMKRG